MRTNRFLSTIASLNATNVFLYIPATNYLKLKSELTSFIQKLTNLNIKAWGMDGDRSYLSDSVGPNGIYISVNNMIQYNAQVPKVSQFYGFETDIEPADQTSFLTFHNDIADSKLDTKSGGIWYKSQKADRQMLMSNWLKIHETLKTKLSKSNLKLGASLPWWLDNYNGEPIQTTYKTVYADMVTHFSIILDEMHYMTYNTWPENVINRMTPKLQKLSNLEVKMCSGMETVLGAGPYVSYADTTGKKSQSALFLDLQIIENALGAYSNYKGTCIHDYDSWNALIQ